MRLHCPRLSPLAMFGATSTITTIMSHVAGLELDTPSIDYHNSSSVEFAASKLSLCFIPLSFHCFFGCLWLVCRRRGSIIWPVRCLCLWSVLAELRRVVDLVGTGSRCSRG
ncbi:hypothetical protein QR685DRAFT_525855 [Neurospora intermedia]|uniref:Secreted protein n=1 Tax=Neurospora intermedia TaxID=5142 RepID=A0ABR3DFT0_NEUIN